MESAISGNQSVSTWRGAKSLFVPCDIMVWKGLHHRLGCRWGGWREQTWTATWCLSHQLHHSPVSWSHRCWNKAPCGCRWMRTFVLQDMLHELPEAPLLHARWNSKVPIHREESGSHSFPYESMVNGACPASIHPHCGTSVSIDEMPFASLHCSSANCIGLCLSDCLYFRIRAPLSSQLISEEPVCWWDSNMFLHISGMVSVCLCLFAAKSGANLKGTS